MFAKVLSCSLKGIESEITLVEVDLSNAIPSFNIVGLPDVEVKESKERVRSAIINTGYKFPSKRITINLSPANTKKEGTHFDLPMAVGIMYALEYISFPNAKEYAIIGELSLDGRINRINGALPLILGLRNQGIRKIILPYANAEEASIIDDIELFPFRHLKEVIDFFEKPTLVDPYIRKNEKEDIKKEGKIEDFSEVSGQDSIKRALQIAAAGAHNILMIGPPGSGKTMLARRIPSILPKMTYEEKLEVTKIYSVAGELSEKRALITERPFRSPHHTISPTAMVGGGRIPKPGEVSLSHFGVLFLDELPEFSRSVLEMLRQPMEDDKVTVSRVNASFTFPSKFIFAASMNPCPCGYYGDTTHECTCTPGQVSKYMSKISGPLLDRIDMHIEVFPVKYKELSSDGQNRSSEEMRKEVEAARKIQLERYKGDKILYNSQLSPALIKKYCKLDTDSKKLLETAFEKMSLSARAYNRIIKLARTIADVDSSEYIKVNHIAEALQYRNLDKKYRVI